MSKAKNILLNCKNPAEYIDKCIKSSLTRYEKAAATIEWRKITGFTLEDIKYARHRHPYWKKKKHKGAKERNMKRHEDYNFSDPEYVIDWTVDLIEEFILLNRKENGIYINKDRELAKHFETTIPSIQYMRRKYNFALKLLKQDKMNPTDKRIFKIMIKDDRIRCVK